jgi:hypothetical protein
MNQIVPTSFGPLPSVIKDYQAKLPQSQDEMAAGVTAGFAVMSFRGKVWRVKHRGEERAIMNERGDGPAPSIEVVIVRAAPVIAKIFYEKGFEEGSTQPPDCWSVNGATPDQAAPKKQSPTCAGCPHNAWGSKITPQGKATKACADSKRLAIVPAGDIENETYGGPMLLRVPAASLQDMAIYANKMNSMSWPYYAVATRLSFDINEAYPKFVFGAIRPLTEDEAVKVVTLRDDPRVSRILAEAVENVQADVLDKQEQINQAFEQPPEPKVQPKAQPVAQGTTVKGVSTAPAAQAAAVQKPSPEGFRMVPREVSEAKPEPKAEAKVEPKAEPKKKAEPAKQEEAGETSQSFDEMLDGLLA